MAKYVVKNFQDAIPGSGGVISTIATRVGCDWHTVVAWLEKSPTLARLYDDECEKTIDAAESVVLANIQAAATAQREANYRIQVDSSDAKWYLSAKAKSRGYGTQSVEQKLTHEGNIDVEFVDYRVGLIGAEEDEGDAE